MKVVIEDGMATVIEEKIVSIIEEEDLCSLLASMANEDSGYLPLGCVRKHSIQNSTRYICVFESKKWQDGIIHPPILFGFKVQNNKAIVESKIYYTDSNIVNETSKLYLTAHRNVYDSGKICLGSAFPTPESASIQQKINSIIGRYFTVVKNGDLDGASQRLMPESLKKDCPAESWSAIEDISNDVKLFKEVGRLGDIWRL